LFAKIVSFCFTILMLVGLVAVYILTGQQEGLLLAIPKVDATVSVDLAEAMNGNMAMVESENGFDVVWESNVTLTYEIRREAHVTALRAGYDVVLIGTNHTYPIVMNFPLSNGTFFCKNATSEGHRVAILNEQAAFDLFGAMNIAGNVLQINGEPYLVLGVIDDGNSDNLNIFIPTTRLSYTVGTIATNLTDGSLSEAVVRSEWRQIEIDERRYHFINLYSLSMAIRNKLYFALALMVISLLCIGVKKMLQGAVIKWRMIGKLHTQMYIAGILKSADFRKFSAYVIAMLVMVAVGVIIFTQTFSNVLYTIDVWEAFGNTNSDSFSIQIAKMNTLMIASIGIFVGFIVCFVTCILFNARKDELK